MYILYVISSIKYVWEILSLTRGCFNSLRPGPFGSPHVPCAQEPGCSGTWPRANAWPLAAMLCSQTVPQHSFLLQGSCCSSIALVLSQQPAEIPGSETEVWDTSWVVGLWDAGAALGWMLMQSVGSVCPGFAAAEHLRVLNKLPVTPRSTDANCSERQVSAFRVGLVSLAWSADRFSWKPSLLGACTT